MAMWLGTPRTTFTRVLGGGGRRLVAGNGRDVPSHIAITHHAGRVPLGNAVIPTMTGRDHRIRSIPIIVVTTMTEGAHAHCSHREARVAMRPPPRFEIEARKRHCVKTRWKRVEDGRRWLASFIQDANTRLCL